MVPHCARPACSRPAVATFNFDGLRRIAWLGPLAEASAFSAGDLCQRHAERMVPPRNWELRDLRPAAGRDLAQAPGVTAPSRFQVPPLQAVPAASSLPPARRAYPEPAPRPAAAASPPREPRPLRTTASGPERASPGSSTPLLARAFRSAGTV